MNLINTFSLEVKKSKFYSFLYEIDNIEEIDIILTKLKNEHKKNCYIFFRD